MRDLLTDLEQGEPAAANPLDAARAGQRRALPKRFYKQAEPLEVEGGFGVGLDGRPIRTPARKLFAVPQRVVAEAVAQEWRDQGEDIDPSRMPLTRLLNVAIDGVATDPAASIEEVVRYAGTDLICYRADGPERLVQRQAQHWDPVLDWLRNEHGIRLILSAGIRHVTQPEAALDRLRNLIPKDEFRLAAIVSLTALLGSATLALALHSGRLTPAEAWAAGHVDEDWNREQWGEDETAAARQAARKSEMEAAARLLALMG
ncbi:MAG: ATP12 family protein [Pseudomonadota bacterium]